ncbi:uncharacterized protein PB18E9.04c [Lingula anatina]|uniref:Uncharacterized protein PB18E9.04c n=1 Tax=Lingula anatina TaxID=7574 RepID=A0A1S3H9U5_LINAN|nr:uncharacterized protein PB18E9.04c [Lingula anatina]|eukprot:XP_013382778.1 uncharacterized protein PB18E9.04c [Lingula anatina]
MPPPTTIHLANFTTMDPLITNSASTLWKDTSTSTLLKTSAAPLTVTESPVTNPTTATIQPTTVTMNIHTTPITTILANSVQNEATTTSKTIPTTSSVNLETTPKITPTPFAFTEATQTMDTTVRPGDTTVGPGDTTVGDTTVEPGYTTVRPGVTTLESGDTKIGSGGTAVRPGDTAVGGTTVGPGETTVEPGNIEVKPSAPTGQSEQNTQPTSTEKSPKDGIHGGTDESTNNGGSADSFSHDGSTGSSSGGSLSLDGLPGIEYPDGTQSDGSIDIASNEDPSGKTTQKGDGDSSSTTAAWGVNKIRTPDLEPANDTSDGKDEGGEKVGNGAISTGVVTGVVVGLLFAALLILSTALFIVCLKKQKIRLPESYSTKRTETLQNNPVYKGVLPTIAVTDGASASPDFTNSTSNVYIDSDALQQQRPPNFTGQSWNSEFSFFEGSSCHLNNHPSTTYLAPTDIDPERVSNLYASIDDSRVSVRSQVLASAPPLDESNTDFDDAGGYYDPIDARGAARSPTAGDAQDNIYYNSSAFSPTYVNQLGTHNCNTHVGENCDYLELMTTPNEGERTSTIQHHCAPGGEEGHVYALPRNNAPLSESGYSNNSKALDCSSHFATRSGSNVYEIVEFRN